MTTSRIEEIDPRALDALRAKIEEDGDSENFPIESIEDIIEYIREGWNYNKTVDSCYINYEFTTEVGDWLFTAYGSEYIKDSCICDMQMAEEISVESFKEIKERKAKKKAEKAEKAANKWTNLVKDFNTVDELLEELKKYKFPEKL